MRPESLYPLFAPVSTLPGVGPRLAGLLERLAGVHVADLLWHLPTAIIDRRFTPKVIQAPAGQVVTMTVQVNAHLPPISSRHPYRVRCSDETGFLYLVFFHAKANYLQHLLPIGTMRVVSGRVEHFNNEIQIAHPDYVTLPDQTDTIVMVEPIYPLTAGLTAKIVAQFVRAAVEQAPALPEWHDPELVRQQGWPSWREALRAVHAPAADADLTPDHPARRRLSYDELLADQLALALVRKTSRQQSGRSLCGNGSLQRRVLAALPFTLTNAQIRCLQEIQADMATDTRMMRLLQGDVGSGKTVVALLALLNAIETGAQAALMAPTAILARQHHATLAQLAELTGMNTALLTGRDKGRSREIVLTGLAEGSIALVVGTHALLQADVVFRDLAMVVIDEQQRFGVHQRLILANKEQTADLLVMTATPIPRTLTLALYGDMDISCLDEKPPGRQRTETIVKPVTALDEVIVAAARVMIRGARVYWVCPLVAESETTDLAAAQERYASLRATLGPQVGLVHGRMKGAERDMVMAAFAEGRLTLLVATTVVEVGVDVPAATVMIIEHAERFGLAQLHQLRGRVGRGSGRSTCLLLYAPPLAEMARARLSILRETDDGFRIAEEDLRLRGAGELLGTRQSGPPVFRLADLAVHGDLLAMAYDDARLILTQDADLATPRGQALRTLLYLFARDAVVKTIQSG